MKPIFIDKQTAAKALRENAFKIDDPDSSDYGRRVIHSFRGMFGADWDLDSALIEVSKAKRIAYTWNMFDHDLAIEGEDGRVVRFAVKSPAEEEA